MKKLDDYYSEYSETINRRLDLTPPSHGNANFEVDETDEVCEKVNISHLRRQRVFFGFSPFSLPLSPPPSRFGKEQQQQQQKKHCHRITLVSNHNKNWKQASN